MLSDGVSLMYQRVQRVECSSPRPVLLLGPLVEASKDLLVTESPAKFCCCLPGELRRSKLGPGGLGNKDVCSAPPRLLSSSWF